MDEQLYAAEGNEHVQELDKVLEDLLDNPDTVWPVEIMQFRRMKVDWDRQAQAMLDDLYERLDTEYGDPEGQVDNEPDKKVELAAKSLIEEVKKSYKVWMCEPTGRKLIYAKEEAEKHWTTESEVK